MHGRWLMGQWGQGLQGQGLVLPTELSWVPSSTTLLPTSFQGLLCLSSSLQGFSDRATPARWVFILWLSRTSGQVAIGHSDRAFHDQTWVYRTKAAYCTLPKCKSITEAGPIGWQGCSSTGVRSNSQVKWTLLLPGLLDPSVLITHSPSGKCDRISQSSWQRVFSPKCLCVECHHQMLINIQRCTFQRARHVPAYKQSMEVCLGF